jgi:hypothetical protein
MRGRRRAMVMRRTLMPGTMMRAVTGRTMMRAVVMTRRAVTTRTTAASHALAELI